MTVQRAQCAVVSTKSKRAENTFPSLFWQLGQEVWKEDGVIQPGSLWGSWAVSRFPPNQFALLKVVPRHWWTINKESALSVRSEDKKDILGGKIAGWTSFLVLLTTSSTPSPWLNSLFHISLTLKILLLPAWCSTGGKYRRWSHWFEISETKKAVYIRVLFMLLGKTVLLGTVSKLNLKDFILHCLKQVT